MKKEQFFADIQKKNFLQNVFFQIDFKNFRYIVIDRIYLEKDGTVSKDFFYRIIRKVFNCVVYSITLFTNISQVKSNRKIFQP